MKVDELPKVLTRHWSVSGTVPTPNQKYQHYGDNFHIGVEAQSMDEAILAVRKVFHNAVLIACHHRGDIHVKA